MSGLLSYLMGEWEGEAIDIYCSNEKCPHILRIDSSKISGIVFFSEKCALENGE